MNENQKTKITLRRTYTKPSLEKVLSVPEETVLGSCNKTDVAGPLGQGTNCQNPGGHACSVIGF